MFATIASGGKLRKKTPARRKVKPMMEVTFQTWISGRDGSERRSIRGALMTLKQTARTLHDLVLLVARSRYEKGLGVAKKTAIRLAAQKYGLLDAEGRTTSKYFALLNDEVEQLVRELTGKTEHAAGLCLCGCGRMTRGRAKTATIACRKRLSRKVSDVTENPILTLASS
jgi:hypothetical protein